MYVFDTDHISLYGRNVSAIVERVALTKTPLITTVVTVEEQIRGRMKQLAEAKTDATRSQAYEWLTETIRFLNAFEVLQYTVEAQQTFVRLRSERVRIGTRDLRIASIVLAHGGIVLTRNRKDFAQVPGLTIEDWSF
jgi:tRNA(fMet)-specific endonuclease VapC